MASTDLQPYYGPLAGEDFARSFINANTDEFGRTIEAGRDDSTDVRAMRMQGGNEFNRLVAAGVPPPDALARVAGKLFYNDPAGMTRAVNPRRSTTPPLPGSAPRFQPNVDPASGKVISYSVLNPDGRVQSTMRAPDLTMPQNVKDERAMLMQQIRGLTGSSTYLPGGTNDPVAPLRNRYLELGTNWQNKAAAPAATPSAPPPQMPTEMLTFSESGPEGLNMRRLPVVRGTSAEDIKEAPKAAADRAKGAIYNTPKGPLKWTGTGWVRP